MPLPSDLADIFNLEFVDVRRRGDIERRLADAGLVVVEDSDEPLEFPGTCRHWSADRIGQGRHLLVPLSSDEPDPVCLDAWVERAPRLAEVVGALEAFAAMANDIGTADLLRAGAARLAQT